MSGRRGSAAIIAATLSLLVFAASASAFKEVSLLGEGAGQTRKPEGLAVDFETGRLFVADTKNNRIDVFDGTGAFVKAFGWNVNAETPEEKLQVCTAASGCQKGSAGAGAGQFNAPTKVAVDNDPASASHHDLYVVDENNRRIEKFDPEGNFILAFGGGVDKTVPGNVCTAESGHTCGAGSNGFLEGEFSAASRGIFVGTGPGGTVYVIDSSIASGEEYRLQKFEASGAEIPPQHVLSKVSVAWGAAIDSTGNFYVSDGRGAIFKYDSEGVEVGKIEEPAEKGEIGAALAVDKANNLYAASFGNGPKVNIMRYDSAGNPQVRFGYKSFRFFTHALAPYHSASGDIYASEAEINFFETEGYRVLQLDLPPPGPLVFPEACSPNPLGNAKTTLNAEINPEGKATTFHFDYISEKNFVENGNSFSGAHPATSTPESGSIGQDFVLHKASAQVDVVPETKYRCRVVASNADAPAGIEGPEGKFETIQAIEIRGTWTFGVETETARLNAEVNPLGIPATGFFEYVDDAAFKASGFAIAKKAPETGEIGLGGGATPVIASAAISGLSAGTTYHFRFVATDEKIKPEGKAITGPTQTFRTYLPGSGGLADERGYELVSPAQKNSAEVAVPGQAGGLFNENNSVRIQAADGNGETITYTSWTSFGDPEGAPSSSQYLSKRTASGWSTENASPFGFVKQPLEVPYRGFTPDLRFAAFITDEPPLTLEAQEGTQNLYLRDNETGQLQALTIEAPQLLPGGQGFCSGYAGAAADGEKAFFAGRGAMAGAAVGKGFNLYEWSAGGGSQLEVVSVLPDGTKAPPAPLTGFGAAGVGELSCTMGQAPIRHAVSEDGSVVFWTYGGEYKSAKRPLLARIDGAPSIQLDLKEGGTAGEKGSGEGTFWAATGDGTDAFFTAPGKLTSAAKAKGQLYRYDTASHSLTDLTPGTIAPEIKGVTGVSEGGDYAYFVAKGALTSSQENAAHEKAVEGANNLYVWHEGEGLRFIAILSDLDERDWETAPERLKARVSPDGAHLAFLTVETEALSGYNNTIAPPASPHCEAALENRLLGAPLCAEAYIYDAKANALTCASCNPAGSRPAGPAQLPTWSNPYEGPRYLSEDGSRLYFESRDVLALADRNERRDVYEFERPGAGTCQTASPDFLPVSEGCLSLVSSGRDEDESFLVDASSSGSDIFFSTRSKLVGWDQNENYDVYDAREHGGFPEPSPPAAVCEGEACKPAPIGPPTASPTPTDTFAGPGNPKPKKPGKRGKKHHHRHKHHHKRRAGR
jgi:DNA-binding beta-propeller fold protein YncE